MRRKVWEQWNSGFGGIGLFVLMCVHVRRVTSLQFTFDPATPDDACIMLFTEKTESVTISPTAIAVDA
jgi:hypothetical protein